MFVNLIILLAVALLLVVLALQNPNPVQICCLKWESDPIPMVVVIIVSFLVGIILTLLFNLLRQRRLRGIIREKENEIMELKKRLIPDKKLIIPLDEDDL
ncbi:MAG: LapA family protein [Candidatus Riflebacteria bacterium]|nr:LapA family protein [Candidatus Riflebacteria bacterium]